MRPSRLPSPPYSLPLALFLGSLLASACRTSPARTPASASPPAAQEEEASPWRAVLLPDPGICFPSCSRLVLTGELPREVGRDDADGTLYFVDGSLRMRVEGDLVHWPTTLTARPIRAYARDGARWYFATADGALFRADQFEGPLVRVGETGGEEIQGMLRHLTSNGMLTARAGDQSFWIGGPGDVFFQARVPGSEMPFDVGFVDRAFGVALVGPGRVFRTTDGGRNFEAVDLGTETACAIASIEGGAVLRTPTGFRRLGPTGGPVPFRGLPVNPSGYIPEESRSALRDSFASDYPLARLIMRQRGGVPLPGGEIAAIDGNAMVVLRAQGGAERTALPGFEGETSTSQLVALRGGVAVHRRSVRGASLLYQWNGTQGWQAVPSPSLNGPIVDSLDGSAVAFKGECETPDRSSDTAACWFDGHTWRTHHFPHAIHSLERIEDQTLLYSMAREGRPNALEFRRVRLGVEDSSRPLTVEGSGARLETASLVPGGLVAGVARRGERTMVALGRREEPLRLQPLPAGAQHVAFASATHGIAVGPQPGELWSTSDGARSWTPLRIPLDGDVRTLGLYGGEHSPRYLPYCTREACFVGPLLAWSVEAPTGFTSVAARRAARERNALEALSAAGRSRVVPSGCETDAAGSGDPRLAPTR